MLIKQRIPQPLLLAWLALVLLPGLGCQPGDPAAEIVRMRARYTAEVNPAGFALRPRETADPAAAPRFDVILDLNVKNDNRENLPQLTVDIVQTDLKGNEVERYRATLDSSGIRRGMVTQVSHTLEDVDFREGEHMFYVEVRSAVPAEQRHLYPEFSGS